MSLNKYNVFTQIPRSYYIILYHEIKLGLVGEILWRVALVTNSLIQWSARTCTVCPDMEERVHNTCFSAKKKNVFLSTEVKISCLSTEVRSACLSTRRRSTCLTTEVIVRVSLLR